MCVGACKACRNGCTQLIRVAQFARVNPDREKPGVSANPDDDRLGRRLALDCGALLPLVGRLVAAGLVEGRRGPDDRSVTIALTAQGQALRERARSVPGEVRRRLGVSEERLAALHESLLEIVAAAEARSGEPPEERRDDGPLLP